MTDKLVKKLAN